MKKVQTSLLLLSIALLLTAASCTKEEPKHRDVVRCEINGVAWEAECESTNLVFGCSAIDCQYYDNTGGFEIAASNKILNNGGFTFSKTGLSGGITEGINSLKIVTYGDKINNIQYNVNEEKPGILTILQIDKFNKIIEGHFHFIVFSSSGDSVKIDNGYFKTKFRP